MPPHRDWTRRGAGRALLYWPIVAFLLVAAFPAVAVPLMIGSGFALLTIGLVGGMIGKRRRARKLARARQAPADVVRPAVPAADAFWPTGRHARQARTTGRASEEPADTGSPVTPDPVTPNPVIPPPTPRAA
ncbi:hypothetical protein WIS52_29715 [Pseudonocardia nematodicida]|uniref:Uncharacterized protein n=1 Tax=Pseudonocardia nematodicida TaxID=1206997 RepID=A0ABV1KJN1_9PSEU